jgi:hypothetical protein
VQVLIGIDPESALSEFELSTQDFETYHRAIATFKEVILQDLGTASQETHQVEVVSVQEFPAWGDRHLAHHSEDWFVCPLTLHWPIQPSLIQPSFENAAAFLHCREVNALRQKVVEHQLTNHVGSGNCWLPVVLTQRGVLYGEVVGLLPTSPPEPTAYRQPFHLDDRWRQPLYRLAHSLLTLIHAKPTTYFVQFSFDGDTLVFDRVWPFPIPGAIASLGVQHPDLFTCHWYCMTGRPILDLGIPGSTPYERLK